MTQKPQEFHLGGLHKPPSWKQGGGAGDCQPVYPPVGGAAFFKENCWEHCCSQNVQFVQKNSKKTAEKFGFRRNSHSRCRKFHSKFSASCCSQQTSTAGQQKRDIVQTLTKVQMSVELKHGGNKKTHVSPTSLTAQPKAEVVGGKIVCCFGPLAHDDEKEGTGDEVPQHEDGHAGVDEADDGWLEERHLRGRGRPSRSGEGQVGLGKGGQTAKARKWRRTEGQSEAVGKYNQKEKRSAAGVPAGWMPALPPAAVVPDTQSRCCPENRHIPMSSTEAKKNPINEGRNPDGKAFQRLLGYKNISRCFATKKSCRAE